LEAQAQWTKGMSQAKLHSMGLLFCVVCLVQKAISSKHPYCPPHKSKVEHAEKASRRLEKLIPGSKKAFADIRAGPRDQFRVFMVDYISKTQRQDGETGSIIRCDYDWAQLVKVRKAMAYSDTFSRIQFFAKVAWGEILLRDKPFNGCHPGRPRI
jgi:hypothetical protein